MLGMIKRGVIAPSFVVRYWHSEQDIEVPVAGSVEVLRIYRRAYQLAGPHVKCQGLECSGPESPYTVLDGREACRMFLKDRRYLFGTPTSELYRSDLVRGREEFFREDSLFEDSEVCFDLLWAHRFGFVHKILTFSRIVNVSISRDTADMGPDLLHAYLISKLYGSRHLSREEMNTLLPRARDEYYQALSYQLLRRRDARFWDYHREGLRMAGETLDRGTLWRRQIPRVLDWVDNPLTTVGSALAWLRNHAGDLTCKTHLT